MLEQVGRQRALHGTPYAFLHFDLQHAGQGEGAHAYGYGLYVTSSLEVARSYAGLDAGGMVPALYRIKGVRTRRGEPEQKAADLVYQMGVAKALAFARSMLSDARQGQEYTQAKGVAHYQAIVDVVQSVSRKSEVQRCFGYVLEVGIPASACMLDWDVPRDCQSMFVMHRLGELCLPHETGEGFYRRLAREHGSMFHASQALLGKGIKGIRYRSSTSDRVVNHVVFSDRDVSIDWAVPDLAARLKEVEEEMLAMTNLGIDRADSRFVEAVRAADYFRRTISEREACGGRARSLLRDHDLDSDRCSSPEQPRFLG